jgi:hypothetical protein
MSLKLVIAVFLLTLLPEAWEKVKLDSDSEYYERIC